MKIPELSKRKLKRIIKEETLRIIREEKARLISEQADIKADSQYAAGQVGGALFDVLEELGLGSQAAREIHRMLKTTAWLDDALDVALNDYLKKLNSMGGMPKPRSMQ